MGFPGGSMVKNPPANAGDVGDVGSIPGSRRSLGVENDNHSSILAWKILQRSLAGYSSWGCKESDTTEQLNMTHDLRYLHLARKES